MKNKELYDICKAEEAIAHIKGWDFSHIEGRYETVPLPWDYLTAVHAHLRPELELLDIDTGGGEVLRSLGHPHSKTAAMENYPPNVALCAETLTPLGIDFRPGDSGGNYPFPDSRFDLVINRHGDFNAEEIHRVLKPGGLFITQQVGAHNDRELVQLLCGDMPLPFPEQTLSITAQKFRAAGFEILEQQEAFCPIRFFDVGAFVWFARIIQWEYPGFSVDTHFDRLLKAREILDARGVIEGNTHRFFLIARKLT